MFFLAGYLDRTTGRQGAMLAARRHVGGDQHVWLTEIQADGAGERCAAVVVVRPLGTPDPCRHLGKPTLPTQRGEDRSVPGGVLAGQVTELMTACPDTDRIRVLPVFWLWDELYSRLQFGPLGLESLAEEAANLLRVMRLACNLGVGPAALSPKLKRNRHVITVSVARRPEHHQTDHDVQSRRPPSPREASRRSGQPDQS